MKHQESQQQKATDLINNLISKSWEDKTFKAELIKNPLQTIEKTYGKVLNLDDSNIRFVVEDQTDDSVIYLNIPHEIDIDTLELTEEQLEMIAGGITPTVIVTGGYVLGVAIGAGATLLIGHYLI